MSHPEKVMGPEKVDHRLVVCKTRHKPPALRLTTPKVIQTRTAVGMASNAGFWIQTFTATVQKKLPRRGQAWLRFIHRR